MDFKFFTLNSKHKNRSTPRTKKAFDAFVRYLTFFLFVSDISKTGWLLTAAPARVSSKRFWLLGTFLVRPAFTLQTRTQAGAHAHTPDTEPATNQLTSL